MDAFNDSNTSEFDENAWDSRQDTSLEFASNALTAQLRAASGPTSSGSSGTNDEHVTDADWRHTNKLNLELMMLQNAAHKSATEQLHQQLASQQDNAVAFPARTTRSKSITSATSGTQVRQCNATVLPSLNEHATQADNAASSNAVRRQRTSSDQDSGVGSTSRKSSLAPSAAGAGSAPCVQLSVRELFQEQQHEDEQQQQPHSLLSKLASIGRSVSRASPDPPAAATATAAERVFEIELREARNVLGGQRAAQTARRDSNTPVMQRRNSLEGVFVRVFKNQASSGGGGGSTAQPAALARANSTTSGEQPHQVPYDSLSLHSSMSLAAAAAPALDYIQLPLVKPPAAGESEQAAATSVNFAELASCDAYTFVVRESELPVRISLYQVAKRGGARHALGHCFVGASELSAGLAASGSNFVGAKRQHRLSQGSTGSSGSASSRNWPGNAAAPQPKWVVLDNERESLDEPDEPLSISMSSSSPRASKAARIEYRLYPTILEAIK